MREGERGEKRGEKREEKREEKRKEKRREGRREGKRTCVSKTHTFLWKKRKIQSTITHGKLSSI